MQTLSPPERKSLEEQLRLHKDEDVYVGKLLFMVDPKKKRAEERILLVGRHRVYVLRAGGKLATQAHMLEIMDVFSTNPRQLIIKHKTGIIELADTAEATVEEILVKLFAAFVASFPGRADSFPLKITPEERLTVIKKKAADAAPENQRSKVFCGGFVDSYKAVCDKVGTPPLSDLCWDIDTLYVLNDVKDFNLTEINTRPEQLTPKDIKALLGALADNTWFTTLSLTRCRVDKDNLNDAAAVFERNGTIEKLALQETGFKKENLTVLCNWLVNNPRIALTQIDLSNNVLEDKGLQALGTALENYRIGIVKLNLSNVSASSKGLAAFSQSLAKNQKICTVLSSFSISGNKLEKEGSKSFSTLLAKLSALKLLNISYCSPDPSFWSDCQNISLKLSALDITGNKISTKEAKHLDVLRFFQMCKNLTKLVIVKTDLPLEMLGGLMDALPKLEFLDISENELNDNGIIALCDAIRDKPIYGTLQTLKIDGNFSAKPTKQRTKAVRDLSALLCSAKCVVKDLSIRGTKESQLKGDMREFLFSIIVNTTLRCLDITGNQIGDKIGQIFSKLLQANQTLETLHWDDNGTNILSFQMINAALKRNLGLRIMPLPINDIQFLLQDAQAKRFLPPILEEIQKQITDNFLASLADEKREAKKEAKKEIKKELKQKPTPPPQASKPKPTGPPTSQSTSTIKVTPTPSSQNLTQSTTAAHSEPTNDDDDDDDEPEPEIAPVEEKKEEEVEEVVSLKKRRPKYMINPIGIDIGQLTAALSGRNKD